MPKAIIFGTGAIGCVYGYILHKASVEVTAVCRSNYEAIQADGITINSPNWGTVHYQPNTVRSVQDAQKSGPFDYVFVCSKAFPGTAELIRAAVSDSTAIVVAQNGIGIGDEYEKLYPDAVVVSCAVWLPATQVRPGVVEMGALEKLEIGTFRHDAPQTHKDRVVEMSKIWTAGGGNATVFDDVRSQLWGKLAVNCTFNPMSALTRCNSTNLLMSSEQSEDVILKVVGEVRRIATAEGVKMTSDQEIKDLMQWQRQRPVGKNPSMAIDFHHGRPMEVEAIVGNTVRIAKKHDLDVPRIELLYFLATALNASIVKPEGWKETVE